MSKHFIPTPEEIRRACLRIQATWSEAERRKRAGIVVEPWEPPQVDSRELFGAPERDAG